LELKAPSRLGARDASLFTAHPGDAKLAEGLLGWTDLASKSTDSACAIAKQAKAIRAEGLEAVVLIGQGGSSQAAMSITKLHEVSGHKEIAFRTMDSLSPVFVNHILGSSDPSKTLYIVASKSGSTIEPLMLERVAWQYVVGNLGVERAAKRFVALTDPGSGLEALAREKDYRLVLSTPKDVGGRFSALTAFGLFPAALVGLDIEQAMAAAREAEQSCTSETNDNPALRLACFLYAGYLEGRDKFSLIMPPSGQVFGLWVEQLVAESLGKEGKGILPNVEVDASVLISPRTDRSVITYEVGFSEGFKESIAHIDESIPALHFSIGDSNELFSRFVIWEYAIAFLGILLDVFPFDQPDVEITKVLVKELLAKTPPVSPSEPSPCPTPSPDSCGNRRPGNPSPHYHEFISDNSSIATLRVSNALFTGEETSADQALRSLLGSLKRNDYFSLNAFLPFRGYGRREALERMRNRVASRLGIVSCLEIGPRYLHSTGQFHKGGRDNGVFLIISADEDNDIAVPDTNYTLGILAATQAQGDFAALASRGRRVVHVHLTGNDSETLSRLADRFCSAVSAVKI
jgi:glucose-6-phosphate isomerase